MAARNQRYRPRRRRGRFGFLYKLLSFLVIFAAILVGCVAFFRVNHIEVSGNSRYTAEEIIAASGVELGENLLPVNRPVCADAITSKLPYVENVAVIKRLPDTVELRVTETTALAALEASGSWWLLNGRCKLLEQGDASLRGNLPRVLGLTPLAPSLSDWVAVDQGNGSEQLKLNGLKNLFAALEARDMAGQLSEFIDLSSGNAIYFGYGEELTVVVPISGDFDRRVLSLERTLETFEEQGDTVTGTLDLTYGDNTARLLTTRWLPDEQTLNGGANVPATPSPSPSPTSAEGAEDGAQMSPHVPETAAPTPSASNGTGV